MPVLNIDGSDLTPLKSMFDAAGWEIPPRIDEALTLTDSQNQLLKAGVDASTTTTHEWMVRGDTPAWILQVERDALKEVTEDTAFMADMEKINRKAGYVTPEQYDEYYRSLQNYTGDLKDAMTIFAGLTGQ
jgi:hypothetical protein